MHTQQNLTGISLTGELSFAQEELWYWQKKYPQSSAYNEGIVVEMENVCIYKLIHAFEALVKHNPVLGNTFRFEQGRPVVENGSVQPDIGIVEETAWKETGLTERIDHDFNQPFDLAISGMRVRIYRREKPVLLAVLHHIICDGWSLKILWAELLQFYAGTLTPEQPPKPSFSAFVKEEKTILASEKGIDAANFWKKSTAAFPAETIPPQTDGNMAGVHHCRFELTLPLFNRLKQLARLYEVSLFEITLSVYQTAIAGILGETDVLIGTPLLNRSRYYRQVAGYFVNTVAVCSALQKDQSFMLQARRNGHLLKEIHAFENVSVAGIRALAGTEETASPFTCFFTFRNRLFNMGDSTEKDPFSFRVLPTPEKKYAQFPLHFEILETESIHGVLHAHAEIFSPLFLAQLGKKIQWVFRQIHDNPEVTIRQLLQLPPEIFRQAVETGKGNIKNYDTQHHYLAQFHSQAAQTPDAAALADTEAIWSYRQLADFAGRVAGQLQQFSLPGKKQGVPQKIAALCMNRGNAYIGTVLGIWQAGFIYMPVDPSLPEERVNQMLQQAQADVFIGIKKPAGLNIPHLSVTEPFAITGTPLNTLPENISTTIAYLLFTSGSTGQPKGVLVGMEGMLNHLHSKVSDFSMDAETVVAQTASQSFDVSVWQMFAVLLCGGMVRIYSREEVLDLPEHIASLDREGVNIVQMVPSYLGEFLQQVEKQGNPDILGSLNYLVSAGEALAPALAGRWFSLLGHCRIANCYGPTEASDNISIHIMEEHNGQDRVPVGRAIDNLQLYVVDGEGKLCLPGVMGEIWVSGVAVAQGYINDAEKTAAVFMEDPFTAGRRLYKTGDLGRWNGEGLLEFHGRKDRQVKIRGQRVELAEIEEVMLGSGVVQQAAVVYAEAVQELRGYMVWKEESGEQMAALRNYMQQRLPVYMLPNQFVEMEVMPLTASGKIDRKKLPAPVKKKAKIKKAETQTQKRLLPIWEKILGVKDSGISDNFFEQGGHSLRAAQLAASVEEEFGMPVPVSIIHQRPTIAQLANWLQAQHIPDSLPAAIQPAPEAEHYPLTGQQQLLWSVCKTSAEASAAYNMIGILPLNGNTSAPHLQQQLEAIISANETLRTNFIHVNGEPRQIIRSASGFRLKQATVDKNELENFSLAVAEKEKQQPFNLEKDVLLRATLVIGSGNKHKLVITIHHLAADGLSLYRLLSQLGGLAPETNNRTSPLQYRDYACWQQQWLKQPFAKNKMNELLGYLQTATPLTLLYDKPAPAAKSFSGGQLTRQVKTAVFRKWRKQAAAMQLPLPALAIGAVQLLLRNLLNNRSVTTGIILNGRHATELYAQTGLFINTLPLHTNAAATTTRSAFLQNVNEQLTRLQEYQLYPLYNLVSIYPNIAKLCAPVFINYQRVTPEFVAMLGNALFDSESLCTSKADLEFECYETGENLLFRIIWNRALFHKETISKLLHSLESVMQQCTEQPGSTLGELALPAIDAMQKQKNTSSATHQPETVRQAVQHKTSEMLPVITDENIKTGLAMVWEEILGTTPETDTLFFDAGGHSLNAVQMVLQIQHRTGIEINVREIIGNPSFGQLVSLVQSKKDRQSNPIPIQPKRAYYPVSPAQKRIWILSHLSGGNQAYAITGTSLVHGRPDSAIMQQAIRQLTLGHEILRTAFRMENDEPVQFIASEVPVENIYRYQVCRNEAECAIAVQSVLNHETDPATPGMLLIGQFEIPGNKTWLAFNIHHLLADGWSVQLLFKELSAIYESILSGNNDTRSEPVIQYRDYACWMQERLGSEKGEKEKKYWHSVFRKMPEPLQLANYPLPAVRNFNGNSVLFELNEEETRVLQQTAAQKNMSRFVLLTAATNILLSQCSGREDIAVGTIVSGRNHADTETMAGCFINTLVLRNYVNTQLSLSLFLETMKSTLLNALAHSEYPFDQLVEALPVQRNKQQNPLFNVLVNYQSFSAEPELTFPGMLVERGEHKDLYCKTDLEFDFKDFGNHIELRIIYATQLFDRNTIQHWAEQLNRLLNTICREPGDITIGEMVDEYPLEPMAKQPAPAADDTQQPFMLPRKNSLPEAAAIEEKLIPLWESVLQTEITSVRDDFFALGGHSLKAIKLAGAIETIWGIRLKLEDIFNAPTIREQAQWLLQQRNPVETTELPAATQSDACYPVSFEQRRMWLMHQHEQQEAIYNICGGWRISGELNEPAWENAWRRLIGRHEILRTVFVVKDAELLQQVLPDTQVKPTLSLQDYRKEQPDPAAIYTAHESCHFDLESGPLVKATLARLTDSEYLFVFALHHIIADAWSLELLGAELIKLYEENCKTGEQPDSTPAFQYKDYALWQQTATGWAEAKTFWARKLQNIPARAVLPFDNTPGEVKTYAAIEAAVCVPQLAKDLGAVCQTGNATLFMGLLAAVQIWLSRVTGSADIVTGIPYSGRNRQAFQQLAGLFLNTLPLRTSIGAGYTFSQVLQTVKEDFLSASTHAEYPFDKLVEDLLLPAERKGNLLFDAFAVLHETSAGNRRAGDKLTVTKWEQAPAYSKFDLGFHFTPAGNDLQISLSSRRGLFTPAHLNLLLQQFIQLLQSAVETPGKSVFRLNYITPGEIQWLNRVKQIQPLPHTTVTSQFNALPVQPGKKILADVHGSLPYETVQQRSDQLAFFLQKEYGVAAGDVVAVCMGRSNELIVTLLAILKTGAAFLPVDPSFPEPRIRFMLEDAGAVLVMAEQTADTLLPVCTREQRAAIFASAPVTALPENRQPGSTAYIIYTSGTTGSPKGVPVTDSSLLHYVKSINEAYGLNQAMTGLLASPVAFDLGYTSLFVTLLNGGCLHLAEETAYWDPKKILQQVAKEKISFIKITPSHFRLLLDAVENGAPGGEQLSLIVLGGEKIVVPEIKRWLTLFPQCCIANHYGPTETTIGVLTCLITATGEQPGTISINEFENEPVLGFPLGEHRAYITDAHGLLCGKGIWGELCIAGPGVSAGYINRLELNAEKFTTDSFVNDGVRMYRTGDRCRYTLNGSIAFGGRLDGQLQVNGYRVEPAEIEACLTGFNGIRQALACLNAENKLVAFYTAPEPVNETEIKDHLRRFLPAYMIPARIFLTHTIALTANGKTNRQIMPVPVENGKLETGQAPETLAEAELVNALRMVMNDDEITIGSDFFETGGDSIKGIQLSAQLHRNGYRLEVKDILRYPQLKEMAANIKPLVGEMAFTRAEAADSYALSDGQRRLWFIDQLEDNPVVYNTMGALSVRGELNPDAFAKAVAELVNRHEILRTVFISENHAPRQYITHYDPQIHNYRFTDLSETDGKEIVLQRLFDKEGSTPFNLAQGPLFRMHIIRMEPLRHVLIMNMHHIISDGWTKNLLQQELLTLYAAFNSEQPHTLAPLTFQYKDYAYWQQRQLSNPAMETHRQFWHRQFEGEIPVLQLPTDYPRPAVKTYNSKKITQTLSAALSDKAQAFAARENITLFTLLFTGIQVLLQRYSGQEDIITGIPTAGRIHPELENMAGLFLTLLPVRIQFAPGESFHSLVEKVNDKTTAAYQHEAYPFDHLVDELKIERDTGRSALFDVIVVSEDFSLFPESSNTSGLKVEEIETGFSGNKFDLTFYIKTTGSNIQLTLGYNALIFAPQRVERMLAHFATLLDALINEPENDIRKPAYVSKTELQEQYGQFNNTIEPYAREMLLHEMFEQAASQFPDAEAIRQQDTSVSYVELNRLANATARVLQEKGIKSGDHVGIITHRTPLMIEAMLAILKAGAAYVPIDPLYPADRQQYIIQNSGVHCILTDDSVVAGKAVEGTGADVIINLATLNRSGYETSNRKLIKDATDLAYIIYTSGSSGRPKGVMIEHHSAVNLVEWVNKTYAVNASDRLLFLTSMCFDLSVYDIFGMLAAGGCIVMATLAEVQDLPTMKQLLLKERISFWDTVPTTLNYLATELAHSREPFSQSWLRVAFMSGDWIPVSLPPIIQKFFPRVQVVSLGGATEGTVWSNYFPIHTVDPAWRSIPYGKPIANNFFYILDEWLNPVPQGVTGELFIGGVGVARGYMNEPEKTAYAFLEDPFSKELGGRMYRTGDLGRMLPDGNMEFLGRKDFQVKIRGFRVELGEIEQVLSRFPGLHAVLVNAVEDANRSKILVAYYQGEAEADRHALNRFLAEHLPDYMIPAFYLRVETFPLNTNGKIDRKALPLPSFGEGDTQTELLPRTETEKAVAEIWGNVLNKTVNNIQENFFTLGGHSLSAAQVISRLQEKFQVPVKIRSVFLHPTVEQISGEIDALRWAQPVSTQPDSSQKKIIV